MVAFALAAVVALDMLSAGIRQRGNAVTKQKHGTYSVVVVVVVVVFSPTGTSISFVVLVVGWFS